MTVFWNRTRKDEALDEAYSSAVRVGKVKFDAHRQIDKANAEITKVNRLLKANGITLTISKAMGNHHG